MDLSFEEADGYLIVRAQGEWTSDTMGRAIRDIGSMAKQHGFTRILADLRDLAAPKTEFARFQAGEDVAKHFGFHLKVAVVCPEEFINKLAENVAVNRGANMRVFSNLDEAVSWLKQDDV